MTFSRPTTSKGCFACSMVFSVSWARRGSTSMETRPSKPLLASYTGAKRSAAARTSSVVSFSMTASTSLPSFARAAMSAS